MMAIFLNYGVLLYTMPLLMPEVVPLDPLVLYIPDRVELGIEGFEVLPPSYWWITIHPQCFCMDFPPH
jgi:hypothetical protein